jgi:hypothetical protein
MIFPFRHTRTKYFLAPMLLVVFLCVSLWQSAHVHHQHGSADAELTFWHMSFVSGLSDRHPGDAEPHGEHSHDAPDKTANLYKHQTGWKTLRGKAEGDNKLKMPAVICARDIAILTPEASAIQTPDVMGGSGAWNDGRPPARAPPIIGSWIVRQAPNLA